MIKKKQNFNSNLFIIFLLINKLRNFFTLIEIIASSDNDNNSIIKLIALVIKNEYIICGSWYIKSKEPESIYILCIVSSVKNNAFTVISDA